VPASSSLALTYTHLGCWADKKPPAVPSQEGDPLLVGSDYKTRKKAIQKCAHVAAKNDFEVFVLQVHIFRQFELPYIVCFSQLQKLFINVHSAETCIALLLLSQFFKPLLGRTRPWGRC